MTVVSALSPISLTQFFYASGKLVRPAKLYFYKPQTEDLVVVFQDPTLGVAHAQPVLTGGSGRVPPVYVGTEPYRIRVFDTNGSHIEDIAYLPGASPSVTEGGGSVLTPEEQASLLQPGDMFFAFAAAATIRVGCVRANGGLIGPTGTSHGTQEQIERYNDDTEALFKHLWAQDHPAVLCAPVIPSRGGTANEDWGLRKAIMLPDVRGRMLFGLAGMGKALSNTLDGVVTDPPGVTDWSGVWAGAPLTTQTIAQMPSHSHGQWTGNANAQLTLGGASAGYTLNQTPHSHTYWNQMIPDRAAVSVPFGTGGADEVMVMGGAPPGAPGAAPLAAGYDNTGLQSAIISLSEPPGGHIHTLTQTPHFHEIALNGSGAAMQTISPLCLAMVYIKL